MMPFHTVVHVLVINKMYNLSFQPRNDENSLLSHDGHMKHTPHRLSDIRAQCCPLIVERSQAFLPWHRFQKPSVWFKIVGRRRPLPSIRFPCEQPQCASLKCREKTPHPRSEPRLLQKQIHIHTFKLRTGVRSQSGHPPNAASLPQNEA